MGNSNSTDANKSKNSNLKSPRKRFLKGKRLKFKGRGSLTDITDKDQGQEPVDPQCVELLDEQVHNEKSVETEENPLQSGLIDSAGGGEGTDERSAIAFKYVENIQQLSDNNGDREPCNPTFVVEAETETFAENSNKCAQIDINEFINDNVDIGDKTVFAEKVLDTPEVKSLQVKESQENEYVPLVNDEIQINVDDVLEQEDEDVTEDLSNTSYTDPLITTPYFSPDEEFENIFDSNPLLEMDSKKEESGGGDMQVEDVKKKEEYFDKEMLKPNASFTVVKHKKVELSPTTFPSTKSSSEKESAILPGVALESNVLRKVASLTFEKATMEQKVHKKFIPEKLDLQIYEKFEGQMLINWFLSSLADKSSLNQKLKNNELHLLAVQFCTQLLSAGVVQQIIDKDAGKEEVFKPNLMYYWAHAETSNVSSYSPGRLSTMSWPPTVAGSNANIDGSKPDLKEDESVETLKMKLQEREKKIYELEKSLQSLQLQAEQQKTVSDIQTLTEKMKFDFETGDAVVMVNGNRGDGCKKVAVALERSDSGSQELNNSSNSLKEKEYTYKTSSHSDVSNSLSPTVSRLQSSKIPVPLCKSNSISHVPAASSDSVMLLNNRTKSSGDVNKTMASSTGCLNCKIFTSVSVSPTVNENLSPKSKHNSLNHVSITSSPKKSTCVFSQRLTNSIPSSPVKSPEHEIIEEIEIKCAVASPLVSEAVPHDVIDVPIVTHISTPTPQLNIPPPPPPPPPPPLVSNDSCVLLPVENILPPPSTSFCVPPPPPPMPVDIGVASPPPPPLPHPSFVAPPPPPMPNGSFIPPQPPPPGMLPPPQFPNAAAPPPPPLPPGMSAPPPPPMPNGSFIPPPPPQFPNAAAPPPPPPPPIFNAPPPPPLISGDDAAAIYGNIPAVPTPLPTPPLGGWNAQRSTFRKQPLTPKVPMKPLYWTRLVVPADQVQAAKIVEKEKLLWAEIEEPSVNEEEFMILFSRQVVEKKVPKKKVEKPVKTQVIKLLDSKRSQNVGILASSLHLDFSEIENAVFNFDTSVVSLEVLQQIYDIRATDEEIALIKSHLNAHPDQPLDKPEQFLLELSEIPHFAERIACFVFQSEFNDSILLVRNKLSNIKAMCTNMMSSEQLKKVMAIILALGNFMNGGNLQRGQADGFGLDILPKLKDVKSKDNSLTLLHYIVKTYLKMCDDPLNASLPVPEPSDIEQAASVQFDDIKQQLQNLKKDLEDCRRKVDKITSNEKDENIQTFKEKMKQFLSNGKKLYDEEFENLEESKKKFFALLKFYHFHPKGLASSEEPNPKDFFPLWAPFCSDFKALWRIEQQKCMKEKLKETRQKEKERRQVKKYKRRESGLKALMKDLSNDLEDD